MSRGASLELRNVSAGYGDKLILDGLSVTTPAGRVLALLGPSGCGKTTALRVTAGLLMPRSGDVLFDGQSVTSTPAERRNTAMVFQKPLLFPHLNVAGNVGFGLRMRRAANVRAAVSEALELVRLSGFDQRRPAELSGGQEQRVALARAIVTNPRVLLLDEPFTALDDELRAEMRLLVRELQRRLAITTVFVTHDQSEAAQVSDEVALLLDGRVEQCGPARSFYEAPRTARAARFFGWRPFRDSVYYRPEHAHLDPGEGVTETGVVADVIEAGAHRIVRIAADSGLLLEVYSKSGETPRPGDRITVRVPERTLVRFGGGDGTRDRVTKV